MVKGTGTTKDRAGLKWYVGTILTVLGLLGGAWAYGSDAAKDYVAKAIAAHPKIEKMAEDVSWIRGYLEAQNRAAVAKNTP